ncbi:MAG: hypothetical protein JNJ40_01255 [Bacteroidia bacterium]|nr:hypothetical protein [Bacteroidia bacterium]
MLAGISMFSQKFLFDSATIELKTLNINTKKESEFSPFIIGKNFFYTSSQERKVGVTHMEKATQHQMLDIYKGYLSDSVTVLDVKALTRKINNSVNQGSCYFDIESSRLYYSGDVPAQSHYKKYKLAIFSSEFKDNEFKYPKIEIVLADTFSAGHPMLYKGRLYFSANLAGGKGATDIYYAEKIDGQWANIKNCTAINSPYHEYFPFIVNNEEIYFSSNRPGGYGKLDIYKCTTIDSVNTIQNLGNPVNSKYDDFGVYIDSLQEGGYFSSDRKKGQDDIYYFKQTWPVFKNCKDPVVENYCYDLTEEKTLDTDSLKGYYYQWSFGDGTTEKGLSVKHCFPGPASYLINLNIIDSVTKVVFMSQATFDLKVDSIVQLKINCLDTVLQNKKFNINTDWTYLPDYIINGYYFEIDGKRMRGKSHDQVFAEKGRHKVLLGIAAISNKTKQKELLCTTKDIICVDSATWLAVEKRQIQKIADQFAYKKFPGDSAMLTDMNYADEELKYTKKGLNGKLAAEAIKQVVDEKIANKNNRSDTVNNNIAAKNKNNLNTTGDQNDINTSNTNSLTLFGENPSDSVYKGIVGTKFIKPNMDTLMNLKDNDDVTFKVHLGTSKTVKDTTLLNKKGITGISENKIGDEYHYTYGNEKKVKDIEKYYDKTVKAGIENSMVVGYKKDSILGAQKKYIKEVDFDKVKSKQDSVRIAKNIAAKNELQNNIENLSSLQLRARANSLLNSASEKDNLVSEINKAAETKTGAEKDSLLAKAVAVETKSQKQKLEASNLNQKANNLDYNNNNNSIKELLTKLKTDKPDLVPAMVEKNAEISALTSETEKLKEEAKLITNNLDKIAALNKIEEKQAEILLKQDALISELKKQYPDHIVSSDPTKNNSKDKTNTNFTATTKNNAGNNSSSQNNSIGNNTNSDHNSGTNTTIANNNSNTKNNSENNTNTIGNNSNGNKNNTSSNANNTSENNSVSNNNSENNTNTSANNSSNNSSNNNLTSNNSSTKNNNTNSTKSNSKTGDETIYDEYGFIPKTDIQKLNMEFLEDFGDLEVEDLEFKVQVGVYKKRKTYDFPKLKNKGLGDVDNEELRDGSTRMTMGGTYKTLRQAFRHNGKIVKAGQGDAFVSVYYKGKRIGIENLRKKGVLVKTQVVTDSVAQSKLTINASNLTEYEQLAKYEEPEYEIPSKKKEKEEAVTNFETPANNDVEEEFVFAPRTNIQKKTMFYAEKYGNIAVDGLEFKVQIAIFKMRNSYSFPKLKALGKIETEIAEEGGTRMTIGGSFKTLNEAFEFNKKVVKAGQTDAFVAVYYQGKRIYIENLERKGIFTSNITVDKAD